MDIKKLLTSLNLEISEEAATQIAEAFTAAVDEKSKLYAEKVATKLDEDHTNKLKALLEAIDNDHTNKLKLVVENVTKDHTDKLNKVIGHYKNIIEEKAKKFNSYIVEELDSFLTLYVEKAIPQSQLNEAVDNVYAKKQLERVKRILGVDPDYIEESTKKSLIDLQKQLFDTKKQLNESYQENLVLNESVRKIEVEKVINEKTEGMSTSKKNFINKLLGDKTASYIEENFNYVVEMFENNEQDQREVAKDTELSSSVASSVGKNAIIEEKVQKDTKSNTPVSGYLTELNRLK